MKFDNVNYIMEVECRPRCFAEPFKTGFYGFENLTDCMAEVINIEKEFDIASIFIREVAE